MERTRRGARLVVHICYRVVWLGCKCRPGFAILACCPSPNVGSCKRTGLGIAVETHVHRGEPATGHKHEMQHLVVVSTHDVYLHTVSLANAQ